MGADAVIARGASVRAAAEGLEVFAVEGGSLAAAGGLQAGDVVRSVDGQPTADLASFAAAMEGIGERTLSVLRGTETVEVRLP